MFDYFEEEDRAYRERNRRWLDRELERSRSLAEKRVDVERAIAEAAAAGKSDEVRELVAERERLKRQADSMAVTAIGFSVLIVLSTVVLLFLV